MMMMMMSKPCRGEMSVIDQGSRLLACARVPFLGTATSTQQREQQGNDRRWSERAATTTRNKNSLKSGRASRTLGPRVWSAPSFINNWTINQREWPKRTCARSLAVVVYLSLAHPHLRLPSPSISISSLSPRPMQGSPAGSIGVRSRR